MKKLMRYCGICLMCAITIFIYLNISNPEYKTPEFEVPSEIENEILKNLDRIPPSPILFIKNVDELTNLDEWTKIDTPNAFTKEWRELESQADNWCINPMGNDVDGDGKWNSLEGYCYKRFSVSDGFFLIIDSGDWGGAVFFYPEGDKEQRYKIKEGHILGMYQMNDEYYMIESQYVADPSTGKVLMVKKKFNKWVAKEIVDLGDHPYCYTIVNDNTIYLVTYGKLLKLANNKIEEIIIEDAFWKGLYPDSVVFDNNFIYIGMRACIAKVNIDTKEIQIFTPVDKE